MLSYRGIIVLLIATLFSYLLAVMPEEPSVSVDDHFTVLEDGSWYCPVCPKTITQKGNRKRHLNSTEHREAVLRRKHNDRSAKTVAAQAGVGSEAEPTAPRGEENAIHRDAADHAVEPRSPAAASTAQEPQSPMAFVPAHQPQVAPLPAISPELMTEMVELSLCEEDPPEAPDGLEALPDIIPDDSPAEPEGTSLASGTSAAVPPDSSLEPTV